MQVDKWEAYHDEVEAGLDEGKITQAQAIEYHKEIEADRAIAEGRA